MYKRYDTIKYTTGNPVVRILLDNFRNTIFRMMRNLQVNSVLDAGCGEGYFLAMVMSELPGTVRYRGFDISSELLEQARVNLPQAEVWQDDIYRTACTTGSTDLVMCTEVLEHVEYPEKAMAELFRISRKYVLLSVPHEPYFRVGSLLRGKYLASWGNHPDHRHRWSKRDFVELVDRFGNVKEVAAPFPWIVVLAEKLEGSE